MSTLNEKVEASAFEEVNQRVRVAADVLGISSEIVSAIVPCEREVVVSLPLRRDDGSIDVLTGYRIQHSSARSKRRSREERGILLCQQCSNELQCSRGE